MWNKDWFYEPWEQPLEIDERQLLFDAWMHWVRIGGFSRQPVINGTKLLPLEAESLHNRVVYMEYETGLKIWFNVRQLLLFQTMKDNPHLYKQQ